MADAAEVGLAVADPEPADVQLELVGEGGVRGHALHTERDVKRGGEQFSSRSP